MINKSNLPPWVYPEKICFLQTEFQSGAVALSNSPATWDVPDPGSQSPGLKQTTHNRGDGEGFSRGSQKLLCCQHTLHAHTGGQVQAVTFAISMWKVSPWRCWRFQSSTEAATKAAQGLLSPGTCTHSQGLHKLEFMFHTELQHKLETGAN